MGAKANHFNVLMRLFDAGRWGVNAILRRPLIDHAGRADRHR
jgi:hypothetical protein